MFTDFLSVYINLQFSFVRYMIDTAFYAFCFTTYSLLLFFRSPADIDIFTGALSERPVFGGLVGPTNACILGNQFRRLKLGDRFFYENPFFSIGFTLGKNFWSYLFVTRVEYGL